jgi:hypothetical protein
MICINNTCINENDLKKSNSSPLSNEAIQSIASVYNKDNLTATNINGTTSITTPTLNVGNDINAKGDISGRFITAGIDVDAKRHLNAALNIYAGNDITAKGDIYGRNITGWDLTANNNLCAGKGAAQKCLNSSEIGRLLKLI